jgi:hypothetical protein
VIEVNTARYDRDERPETIGPQRASTIDHVMRAGRSA